MPRLGLTLGIFLTILAGHDYRARPPPLSMRSDFRGGDLRHFHYLQLAPSWRGRSRLLHSLIERPASRQEGPV